MHGADRIEACAACAHGRVARSWRCQFDPFLFYLAGLCVRRLIQTAFPGAGLLVFFLFSGPGHCMLLACFILIPVSDCSSCHLCIFLITGPSFAVCCRRLSCHGTKVKACAAEEILENQRGETPYLVGSKAVRYISKLASVSLCIPCYCLRCLENTLWRKA